MSTTISCPNCHADFQVNELLQTQLSEKIRAELEIELRGKHVEISQAQQRIAEQEVALKSQRQSLADQIKAGVEIERRRIVAEAKAQAAETLAVEIRDRDSQVQDLKARVATMQSTELELRKRERELKEQAEAMTLTVARQIDAEREKIRQQAMKQVADEHQMKDAEYQKMVSELRRQIEDLRRKAEQGSQQTQGEVQEIALEELLSSLFPADTIIPVGKGVTGGDVHQQVFSSGGISCGTILWESKRTKNWSKSWLPKLRDDQRTARAECAVIVTETLPDGVDNIARIDGVWVCSWACVSGLALALRQCLIEVGKHQLAANCRLEKTELVYNYLSSKEFQQRIAGTVEAIGTLQADLAAEKRSMQRMWSKREQQINRAFTNTAGMFGDLQGIIGPSMPTVEGLVLPGIEQDTERRLIST